MIDLWDGTLRGPKALHQVQEAKTLAVELCFHAAEDVSAIGDQCP